MASESFFVILSSLLLSLFSSRSLLALFPSHGGELTCWGVLGQSWGGLGVVLGRSWGGLGDLGAVWGENVDFSLVL